MRAPFVIALTVVSLWAAPAAAVPITYDFEEFGDGDVVSFLLGPLGSSVSITNAAALTAGVSLNDFDFPPVSGSNVIFDAGGAITLAFSSSVSSFSGFFTYTAPVSIVAFFGGVEVGTAVSAFSENYLSSGNAPNELLELANIGLFDSVVIIGGQLGGSFTLDNMTIDVPERASVPEPGTLSLLTLGAGILFGRSRLQNRKSRLFRTDVS